jgi:hypothetical protein
MFCNQAPLEPVDPFYYFNSFETKKDTTNWQGISYTYFVDEPAPNGGNKSLLIAGGCIQPTAFINFAALKDDEEFQLSCWGKVNEDNQSGTVSLLVLNEETLKRSVSLNIDSKKWTYYKTDTIKCKAGEHFRIEIMIGGIKFASMNLDLFMIKIRSL